MHSNEHNSHPGMPGTSTTTTERDPTWICIFCKEPPHFDELGDLYGPYFVPKEGSKGTPGRKRKNTGDFSAADLGRSNCTPTKNTQEIWFHQDCICWSSGVYLIGQTIKNMEEVVRDSRSCLCSICEATGANLGCVFIGCQMRFHFPCAKRSGCLFNEDNFSILCQKHKDKYQQTSSQGDPVASTSILS